MTKKIVVDSSVIFKWLSKEKEARVEKALKLFTDGQKGKCQLYAPILSKYEIGNGIWKRGLDLPKSKLLVETLYAIPINFIDLDEGMAKRGIEIAILEKITFYDASFIALAERLRAGLITDNPKHQKSTLKTNIKVVSLASY
ncbi:MAG: type II toxin-antitoxin system VapC family toxin [Patescibacteria group bacterium]